MSDLNRFLEAQENDYADALAEIKAGRKRTHWMWYIFPQIDGLGVSSTAKFYAIRDLNEAREYFEHPVLGARLIEISEAVLNIENKTAYEILGSPDDLKLKSSMTLFAALDETNAVFQKVLDKYYGGEKDLRALQIIGQ